MSMQDMSTVNGNAFRLNMYGHIQLDPRTEEG